MEKVVSVVMNEFTHDNRVLNQAHSLARHRFDIEVVALHKDGLEEKCEVEGIPVTRIKLSTRAWPRILFVQVFKYMEFLWRAVRIQSGRTVDVVHCHDLAALPIGVLIKLFSRRKARVIYDAHEYETEMNGLHGVEKVLAKVVERLLIKRADEVITVTETIGDEYARLYGIRKPIIIMNCPREMQADKTANHFRRAFGIRDDQRIFIYQGALSRGRGIEAVVEAFQRLDSGGDVVVFMGFGAMVPELEAAATAHPNIYFHKAVSPKVLLDYTASADVGISLIEDISLSDRYCLPNKLFEYIAVGIPTICSNLPEMARFISETGVGVIATDSTANGLIDAIRAIGELDGEELLTRLHEAKKQYNWAAQEKKLLAVYAGTA